MSNKNHHVRIQTGDRFCLGKRNHRTRRSCRNFPAFLKWRASLKEIKTIPARSLPLPFPVALSIAVPIFRFWLPFCTRRFPCAKIPAPGKTRQPPAGNRQPKTCYRQFRTNGDLKMLSPILPFPAALSLFPCCCLAVNSCCYSLLFPISKSGNIN